MAGLEDNTSILCDGERCSEYPTEYKTLKCGHSLCLDCARQNVIYQGTTGVECPMCRKFTPEAEIQDYNFEDKASAVSGKCKCTHLVPSVMCAHCQVQLCADCMDDQRAEDHTVVIDIAD